MELLLFISGLSRSVYYYHRTRTVVLDRYAVVKRHIMGIFQKNKARYGSPRITEALKKMGLLCNHKVVERLMRELGLKARVRPKRYVKFRETGMINGQKNLLARVFNADQPNQKWTTDITEFRVCGQRVYLSAMMDLYNREIISYRVSERIGFDLVDQTLKQALSRLEPHDYPMIHSDQGWHYRMKPYVNQLLHRGLQQSMSGKGNCLDNAAMESCFAIIKTEFFYGNTFKSIDSFKQELDRYIRYYNHDRIKLKLAGMAPVDFRLAHALI